MPKRHIATKDSVDYALRHIIGELDYDLHKVLEFDEETGADRYPTLTKDFIKLLDEHERLFA